MEKKVSITQMIALEERICDLSAAHIAALRGALASGAHDDGEVVELAFRHMRDYANVVSEIGMLVPDLVLRGVRRREIEHEAATNRSSSPTYPTI